MRSANWKKKSTHYDALFVVRNKHNTLGIIKYPFWRMTAKNPDATYACLNYGEAVCPREIERQAICIDGDLDACLLAVEEGDRA